ncbi:FAD-dependent oxidoreductase [Spirosoma endbachense]|uniref:FAD-dependent oxidoreductase n=1 Tax=Spirosoma endbachense TaxID=2666025 RepID=A0A6P1W4I6_9BACT|nr:FAD-dependent oxidoreductase [Spirosoma endbachense]QHW00344.1 FAD-dependent oxidoreductase [Spirosoma endbachense]
MTTIFNHLPIPLLAETDILVIGAGSAGCVAALSAATHDHCLSVMLVERYGFPGGTSTQMLDTFYGFFTPGATSRKIVGGWPDRIVNELDKVGAVFLRPNTYGAGTGVNYNPERLKLVWDQMIQQHSIRYLLHTTLIDIATEGERYVCIFWNKGGFQKVIARRVIDASGDADFCHLAGFAYEIAGENELAQSLTTTFRMSNVELDEYERAGGKKMLALKMQEAVASGRHPLPRKEGSAHEMNAPKCISTVAVKVAGLSALHADELTKAEIEGRRQAFVYEDFFRDDVPGYQNANIIGLSHQIGVRETRRVYGEHRLTKEECLSGLLPDNRIFLCGAPIEDHRHDASGADETYWEYIPGSGVYGVPYGTIVPKGSQSVWVVGRCFSATHDAHASCRSMAQTMSMGQAAGLAAVQSLRSDEAANSLTVKQLQQDMYELGAILDVPDTLADTSRYGWKANFPSSAEQITHRNSALT